MSRDNRVSMPQSMGGLVRYFDEYKSKIEIKPQHVIVLCVVVSLLIILLHAFGGSWFAV
ncbi:preprotein translocase subunit Sec61beta [Candidatus Woesearchaeota archaeon]|nr:preprotein translocase subunit Sec61beta [Candidatus Woesearchaeota archaeon]